MRLFQRSKLRFPILLSIVFLLTSSTPLGADSLVRKWSKKVERAEHHLREREWDAAYKKTQRLSRDLLRHASGGTGLEEFLARIFVIQAIAEAGRRNERLALWNWQAALALHPRLQEQEPGEDEYGGNAELFRDLKARVPPDDALVPSPSSENVLPPRELSWPRPKKLFPRGRRSRRPSVRVEMIVTREGKPTWPRVVRGFEDPMAVFSALLVLREWTFEPATLDGEPVDAIHYQGLEFMPFWDWVGERGDRSREDRQE